MVPTVNDRCIKPPFPCKAKRLDLNKNYPNPPRIKSFSTNRTRKWSFIHSTHLPRNHYELAVSFLKDRVADSTPTNPDYSVFTLFWGLFWRRSGNVGKKLAKSRTASQKPPPQNGRLGVLPSHLNKYINITSVGLCIIKFRVSGRSSDAVDCYL